jgi:hypothetical protein
MNPQDAFEYELLQAGYLGEDGHMSVTCSKALMDWQPDLVKRQK